MNKAEFLNSLIKALLGLPKDEVKKSIDYYCEMIDDAVENGEDEQEVIARLGNIDEIAEKIINETPIRKFVQEDIKQRKMQTATLVLLIVGSPVWFPILIAFFAVAFALYVSIWAIIVSVFAVFAALALSGVTLIVASPFFISVNPAKALLSFGFGLVSVGLAAFIFFAALICAKLTIRFTVFIGRKIKDRFIKKGVSVNE